MQVEGSEEFASAAENSTSGHGPTGRSREVERRAGWRGSRMSEEGVLGSWKARQDEDAGEVRKLIWSEARSSEDENWRCMSGLVLGGFWAEERMEVCIAECRVRSMMSGEGS